MVMDRADRSALPGDRVAVAQVVRRLSELFPQLDVRFYDPKCFLWLPWVWRYRLRAGETAWVVDGRVIARGVPSVETLALALQKAK